jgi:hypothetical protein
LCRVQPRGRSTFALRQVQSEIRCCGCLLYHTCAESQSVNDDVGPYPIVVYVDVETQGVYAYLRQVDEQVLTFTLEGLLVRDGETGSTWRMDRGVAVDGPLQGQALRPAPYIPAFSKAWRDFYPHSRWYGED